MKKVTTFLVLSSILVPEFLCGSLGGDYYMSIDKIDNQPELSREYADWHLFVRRINKTEKVLDGYYIIKKDIIQPKVVLNAYILSNNKFHKMAVNELVPTDVCDENVSKAYLQYLEGNSSLVPGKECVMRPGYMQLKKNMNRNFDVLAHKILKRSIYGTYKLVGKILNKDNKTMGGATWTVTAKRKD